VFRLISILGEILKLDLYFKNWSGPLSDKGSTKKAVKDETAVVLTSGYRGWPRPPGSGRVLGEDPTRRNPMFAPRPFIV
jgi:hypothetical protein